MSRISALHIEGTEMGITARAEILMTTSVLPYPMKRPFASCMIQVIRAGTPVSGLAHEIA